MAQRNINEEYDMGKELGKGGFSVVYLGKRKKTGEQFAIKAVDQSKLTAKDVESMVSETKVLYQLDHPNILKLHDHFAEPTKLYLVTEYCAGGELFERIAQREYYTEADAQKVLRALANVLEYCHRNKVIHRDLKPENILMLTPEEDSPIKVADFGLAKVLDGDGLAETKLGTPAYLAPEIIMNQPYDSSVDCWAFGVIMYVLLGGYLPFHSESNDKELYAKIMKADYKFDPEYWGNVSASAKDLIESLLVVDPAKRLNVHGILNHPWIKESVEAKDITPALGELRSLLARRRLKRSVGALVALNKMKSLVKT